MAYETIAQMRAAFIAGDLSGHALQAEYGVSRSTIVRWRELCGIAPAQKSPRRDEALAIVSAQPNGIDGTTLRHRLNITRQDLHSIRLALEAQGLIVCHVINRQTHVWVATKHEAHFSPMRWVNISLSLCQKCGARAARKRGKEGQAQRYHCKECGRYTNVSSDIA